MTDNRFLIKIIPPEGYNVYRLHLSRWVAVALVLALIAAVGGALGVHAWQLHVAEENVRALQVQTSEQQDRLQAIDRQAESLAGQLRDIQRQDAEIRHLLGVGPAQTGAKRGRPDHAMLPAGGATMAFVQARLTRLASVSHARLLDAQKLERLTHRVLDLRRIAGIARERLIASLPSLNPVDGTISAGYGWRINPWPEFHRGLDLAADYGTPVHAAADGIVQSAGWDGGFGNKVDVDHGNGYHTWYAHLSRFAVAAGERVRKGETIAYVGATGEATGPHLHYQVMLNGNAIDPAPFLNGVPPSVLATLPSSLRVQ